MTDPFARAQLLIGTPFRPHGRDPVLGLDCVGLAMLAFDVPIHSEPTYRLSGTTRAEALTAIAPWFEGAAQPQSTRNLLAMFDFGRCLHFAVAGDNSFIHADLRLRRVVERPFDDRSRPIFFRERRKPAWQRSS